MELASVSGFLGLLPPALIAFAFFWAVKRAGSRQVIVHRLWQFVRGKHEIADPEIRAFAEEEASFISFRILAGVPVSSLEKAHELIRWTKLNDVQMYRLRLCGDFFDPDARQILVDKLPSASTQKLKAAWMMWWLVAAAVSFGSLFLDRTVLSLNATQRSFFATSTAFGTLSSIIPFGFKSLKAADCTRPASANAERSGFTEQEVGILCSVLTDSGTNAFLKRTLAEQFWLSAKLFLVTAVLFWMSFFSWIAGVSAKKLAGRQIDPAVPGTQLSLGLST
jgi:hypothetical protein